MSNAATKRHQELIREDPTFAMEFAWFNLGTITGTPKTDNKQHDAAFLNHDDDQVLFVNAVEQSLGDVVSGIETGEDGKLLSCIQDAEDDFEDVDDAELDSKAGDESQVDNIEDVSSVFFFACFISHCTSAHHFYILQIDPDVTANTDGEQDLSDLECMEDGGDGELAAEGGNVIGEALELQNESAAENDNENEKVRLR